MACRSSLIAEQFIHVLTLRINAQRSCPPTTLHIVGDQNSMTDISLDCFGSKQNWHFKTEADLLIFFNLNFPLPNQNSWTVSQPTSEIATRVISTLGITHFKLVEWRRLPIVTQNIWTIGKPIQGLWEWTLIFRTQSSQRACRSFLDSWQGSTQDTLVKENRSNIAQSAVQLQLLAR